MKCMLNKAEISCLAHCIRFHSLSDLQKHPACFCSVLWVAVYLCCGVLPAEPYSLRQNMSRTHCPTHFRIHPTAAPSVNTSVMSPCICYNKVVSHLHKNTSASWKVLFTWLEFVFAVERILWSTTTAAFCGHPGRSMLPNSFVHFFPLRMY